MPASYEIEALKAQAVVARTYTKYKEKEKKHDNADICDSSLCCQAWISKENRFARWDETERESNWEKIVEAVNSTAGKYIVYEGEPINALFHSNSAGMTEIPINVWGGSYPYLQSVETSGEEAYSTYSSEVQISKDELIQKMLEKYSKFEIDFSDDDCMRILEYNESGRVKNLKVGNINLSGVEARSIFGLKSAKFEFMIEGDYIKFLSLGYGHGVGLSQSGSDSLAKQGLNYEEIIHHYYKNVEIIE
jgi:stage II sporulation protein D